MLGDLTGRTVMVLGATRGIGLATCGRVLDCGGSLLLSGRDAGRASATAASLADRCAAGASVAGVQLDIAAPSAEQDLEAVLDAAGVPDALIYNAGVSPTYKRPEHSTLEEWDAIHAVNLRGAYLAALVVGRRLIAESRPGAVTFIASIATLAGASRLTAYGAAKAGLAGLTRSLAVDWAEHGIRVNAVAPGWVATDLTQGLQDNPKLKQRLVDDVPMGRMAEPADIADVPVFLSSEGARYVTGSIWPVDGGLLA